MIERKPTLCVVAGPNGSGKTSTTIQLLNNEWTEESIYINPDNIAQEIFGDWNSPDSILKATKYVPRAAKMTVNGVNKGTRYLASPFTNEWIRFGNNEYSLVLRPVNELYVGVPKSPVKNVSRPASSKVLTDAGWEYLGDTDIMVNKKFPEKQFIRTEDGKILDITSVLINKQMEALKASKIAEEKARKREINNIIKKFEKKRNHRILNKRMESNEKRI